MDTTVRADPASPSGRVLLDAQPKRPSGKPLALFYYVRRHPGATVSRPVNCEEL